MSVMDFLRNRKASCAVVCDCALLERQASLNARVIRSQERAIMRLENVVAERDGLARELRMVQMRIAELKKDFAERYAALDCRAAALLIEAQNLRAEVHQARERASRAIVRAEMAEGRAKDATTAAELLRTKLAHAEEEIAREREARRLLLVSESEVVKENIEHPTSNIQQANGGFERIVCGTCKGAGNVGMNPLSDEPVQCAACEGSGFLVVVRQSQPRECGTCKGKGWCCSFGEHWERCPACRGKGWLSGVAVV